MPKPEPGGVTRLRRCDAGVETSEAIAHDFWEEVWILDGELIDLGKRQTFAAGMYACRPPGMVHGPYRVPRGCTTLEIRYGRRAEPPTRHPPRPPPWPSPYSAPGSPPPP